MHRIEWTEAARDDLRAVRAFVARDSVHYADRVVGRIKAAVESAQQFPDAASRVPEIDRDDVREDFAWQYRILYQRTDEVIYVLAVIHGARSLPGIDLK